ncbi:uncharacterized protein LOC123382663 [Felis catus]|uniref:uncharacterized protein LOC123382663 n=1 Tax=Felis catus TaxID=9685 RepID=UPI001D1A24C7|nr:uncharacterized protein LOC123382663 [Felis catus]
MAGPLVAPPSRHTLTPAAARVASGARPGAGPRDTEAAAPGSWPRGAQDGLPAPALRARRSWGRSGPRRGAARPGRSASGSVHEAPLTKLFPFVLKPKDRPTLSPVLLGRAFVVEAQPRALVNSVLFKAEPDSFWNPGVAGRLNTFSPYPSREENGHPFVGEDIRATTTRLPQTAFPVGTSVPSLCQLLGERDLERSPASATGSGSPGRIWGLKAPVFQVPGLATRELPGPGTAKTRRGCARDIHSRHPSGAATGSATIRRRAEVQPAQPRGVPTLQEDQGRGAQARTRQGQELWVGRARAEAAGSARRIPARLGSASGPGRFPRPGRVFHSTVCLGEVGDVLGAQGAGYGHKSSCETSFPSLTRRCSWPPWRPGLHWVPCFPRHGLGFPGAARGVKAGASPFAKEREQPRPVLCHRLPSPRLLDPEAARASLDLRLGEAGNKPSGGYLASAEQSRPRARSGTITSKRSLLFARDFGGDSRERGRPSPPRRHLPLTVPVTQLQRPGADAGGGRFGNLGPKRSYCGSFAPS